MKKELIQHILSYLSIIEKKKISIINKNLCELYYEKFHNSNTIIVVYNLIYGYLSEYLNTDFKDDYNFILNNIIKDNNRYKFLLKCIVDTSLYFPDKKILLVSDRINLLNRIEELFETDYVVCETYDNANYNNYDIIILSTPLVDDIKLKLFKNKIIIDLADNFDIFNDNLTNRLKLYKNFNYDIEMLDINLYKL
jgi:hypothetical protein